MKTKNVFALVLSMLASGSLLQAANVFEIEPNDTPAEAQALAESDFTLDASAWVNNSTLNTSLRIPNATLYIDHPVDDISEYFTFEAKEGDRIIIDGDLYYSIGIGAELSFSGTSLTIQTASPNYINIGDYGTSSGGELFLQITAPATGTYTLHLNQDYLAYNLSYITNISVGNPNIPVVTSEEVMTIGGFDYQPASFGVPAANSDDLFASVVRFLPNSGTGSYGAVSLANDTAIVAGLGVGPGGSGYGAGGGSGSASGSLSLFPDNGPRFIAREGDNAPGLLFSAPFASFTDPIYLPGTRLAFSATLKSGGSVNSTNNTGVWAYYDDLLTLVAAEGGAAPGYTGKVFATFKNVWMSNLLGGQSGPVIAFLATVRNADGSDVPSNAKEGLWATDIYGELTLVVRRGSVLPVNGVDKTVSSIGIFAGMFTTRCNPRTLSDEGTLTYRLKFTDGTSGIFTWSP